MSITRGYTFGATELVTNTKLHNLVDNATIVITPTDLSATSVTNTKISDVSGSKFTDLSSITAAAGVIPAANIPPLGSLSGKVEGSQLSNLPSTPSNVGQFPETVLTTIVSASHVHGTALTNLSGIPANSVDLIPANSLGSGSASSSTYLRGDGFWGGLLASNCVFAYSMCDTAGSTVYGIVGESTGTIGAGVSQYWGLKTTQNAGEYPVIRGKYKHQQGVSLLTLWSRFRAGVAAQDAYVYCTIDTLTAGPATVTGVTMTWTQCSANISSLSVGTVYDVIINVNHDGNKPGVAMDACVGIVS